MPDPRVSLLKFPYSLPLDTMLLLISELLPKVHELQANARQPSNAAPILEYLRAANLKDVLPAPPLIAQRRFQVKCLNARKSFGTHASLVVGRISRLVELYDMG